MDYFMEVCQFLIYRPVRKDLNSLEKKTDSLIRKADYQIEL